MSLKESPNEVAQFIDSSCLIASHRTIFLGFVTDVMFRYSTWYCGNHIVTRDTDFGSFATTGRAEQRRTWYRPVVTVLSPLLFQFPPANCHLPPRFQHMDRPDSRRRWRLQSATNAWTRSAPAAFLVRRSSAPVVAPPVEKVEVKCWATAVGLLEANAGRTLAKVTLRLERWAEGQSDEGRRDEAVQFRRFVEALGRGDVDIQDISFVVTDWDGLPEVGMERLFGEVLPTHPTLRSIGIYRRTIPTRFVRLLTSSVLTATNAAPLTKLGFTAHPIVNDDVEAIANMVDRRVALTELAVHAFTDGSSAGDVDVSILCRSVSRNSNLRVLHIRVKDISADALALVACSSSPLRELMVCSVFSDLSMASLASQLRTNTTLTRLTLRHEAFGEHSRKIRRDRFRPIEDALETYNYSLLDVDVQQWLMDRPRPPFYVFSTTRVDRLVRRNRWIQRALQQLEPRSYHVSPTSLWPSVLEVVSPLPTLVYRFLRKGDVNKLWDLLRSDENVRRNKKRSRDVDDDSVVREQREG
jgi:hypothetical protein